MVRLKGVKKYFPNNGIQALDNVDFELQEGQIHALLGENGAGKSTLMHIMAGYLRPDGGNIVVDNMPRHFAIPRGAIKAGIGMVRQNPQMIPGFRVWEDCTVGLRQSRMGIISPKKSRKLVQSVSDEWGFDLSVEDLVENITIGQRQKAAILSLLLKKVTYFILDEPTAVLSIVETEKLFYLLKKLRDEGKGIVIISHKLEETLAVSDHVTVLRNGKLMTSQKSGDVSMQDLSAYMFGNEKNNDTESVYSLDKKNLHLNQQPRRRARCCASARYVGSVKEIDLGFNTFMNAPEVSPAWQAEGIKPPPTNKKTNDDEHVQQEKNILQVNHLSVEAAEKPFLRGIDFASARGKIIGFAGVKDSGTETLELVLAGFLSPKNGSIMLNDTSIEGQGTGAFRKNGGAYLSGDRIGIDMAYNLPLYDSLIIHAHRRLSGEKPLMEKFGFMNKAYLDDWVNFIMEKAGVLRSAKYPGEAFSGGMIQRIVLQRELAEDASLYILSEPVWGLDRNAVKKTIDELKDFAAERKSILVFSSDLDFLISVSDEIIVLKNGGVSSSFEVKDYSETLTLKKIIGEAMIGSPRYRNTKVPL